MKKKLVSILLMGTMAAALLVGCGSTSDNSEQADDSQETSVAQEESGSSEGSSASEESSSTEDNTATSGDLHAVAESLAASTDFSEQVTLDFASAGSKGAADASIFEEWMAEVEELSGGAITFTYYSDGSVGTDSDILQQVMDGSMECGGCGIGPISQYASNLQVFQMPFLITDYDLEYQALQTEEWQAIVDEAEQTIGCLYLCGQYDVGLRHFASTKGAIETIDDMAGLKIRSSSSDLILDAMTAIGASPITTSYSEIYTSLQNNVVDAEEVNYATFAGQGHYEIVDYFSEIGMYPYSVFLIFNKTAMDSLPDGYWDFMQAVMAEQEEIYFSETMKQADADFKQECIDAGVTINTVQDPEDFQEACESLYEEYSAQSTLVADFIEAVKAMQ